jgi:cholesterol transport system auxiliary component
MFYRLSYADPMQARTYANSRWTANPLQMMTQRLKTRIAPVRRQGAVGNRRLARHPAAAHRRRRIRPQLQQRQPERRPGRAARLAVPGPYAGRPEAPSCPHDRATSADAAGGARALAASTDAIAADIVAWLGTLDLNRR